MARHRDRTPPGDEPRPVERFVLALYDEHAANLLGWFQSRTYSRDTAADLTAETFAVVIESYPSFDPERGEPGAWLWGIARHQLSGYQRTAAVEQRARARLAMRTPVADDRLERLDDRLDAQRLASTLDRCVGALSESVRAAVHARVLDGLSYRDVAARLGCSEAAARTRVSRGLSTLLDELAAEDPEATR